MHEILLTEQLQMWTKNPRINFGKKNCSNLKMKHSIKKRQGKTIKFKPKTETLSSAYFKLHK